MIIRIMGEGQFDVADVEQDTLQKYDAEVENAIASGDADQVHEALVALRTFIIDHAEPMPDDYLGSSDIVIPYPDAQIQDIERLLSDEGLIPDFL